MCRLYSAMHKDTICFTVSAALWRSMTRLCTLISYLSQVFDPSPHGVLRVVIFRIFVGMRTGPFTFSSESRARRIRSPHTTQKKKIQSTHCLQWGISQSHSSVMCTEVHTQWVTRSTLLIINTNAKALEGRAFYAENQFR